MLHTTYSRWTLLSFVLLAALAGRCAPPAVAQQPIPTSEEGKQLLRDAHTKSQEAKTLEEYTEIIELCQRAATMPLSENLVDYQRKLRAWAHNQRGEQYSEEAAALVKAAQTEAAAKRDAQALEEFETAIELNPDYWKAIHNRGVSRALRGQLDEAVRDFTRAVELKPDYANAWFNRGEILYDQGKFQEAIADYSRSLELNKDDYDTHIRRGHAWFQIGKFQEALDDYDRAVKIAPDNIDALVNRADANRSLGRFQAAADDYLRAVQLDPKSGRAYQGAAWLMATCPDPKMRNNDLALRAAQQALEILGRQDYKALDTMAAALANAGDFDKAKPMQADAIKVAPPDKVESLQKRLKQYEQGQPYRDQ